MPRSKTAPKADPFDDWLATRPRSSRICATCRDGGQVVELAARYVERAKAGISVPSLSQFHEYVTANAGYRWKSSAFSKHIRVCLGYKASD